MNNMIFLTTNCPNNIEILKVLSFISTLLKIIFIIITIGLIVMVSLELAKNIISGNENDMKKNLNMAIKRIIYCIALFLVSTIVSAFIGILGDSVVDYANYLKCANSEDIKIITNQKAAELVAIAKQNLDYISYEEAKNVVSQIEDEELKKEYEAKLETIKETINANKNTNENNNSTSNSGLTINGNSSIEVDYPDEVIENLASFIGSENGGHPDGFLAQLLTGAVYINNFYTNINKEINTTTMCEMFL